MFKVLVPSLFLAVCTCCNGNGVQAAEKHSHENHQQRHEAHQDKHTERRDNVKDKIADMKEKAQGRRDARKEKRQEYLENHPKAQKWVDNHKDEI